MADNSEKLFVILILFFGLAVAFLLASNAEAPSVVETAIVREISPELSSAKLKLDFSIFDSILFKQLKVFGIIPVNPGQTGREDPFRPF